MDNISFSPTDERNNKTLALEIAEMLQYLAGGGVIDLFYYDGDVSSNPSMSEDCYHFLSNIESDSHLLHIEEFGEKGTTWRLQTAKTRDECVKALEASRENRHKQTDDWYNSEIKKVNWAFDAHEANKTK